MLVKSSSFSGVDSGWSRPNTNMAAWSAVSGEPGPSSSRGRVLGGCGGADGGLGSLARVAKDCMPVRNMSISVSMGTKMSNEERIWKEEQHSVVTL